MGFVGSPVVVAESMEAEVVSGWGIWSIALVESAAPSPSPSAEPESLHDTIAINAMQTSIRKSAFINQRFDVNTISSIL